MVNFQSSLSVPDAFMSIKSSRLGGIALTTLGGAQPEGAGWSAGAKPIRKAIIGGVEGAFGASPAKEHVWYDIWHYYYTYGNGKGKSSVSEKLHHANSPSRFHKPSVQWAQFNTPPFSALRDQPCKITTSLKHAWHTPWPAGLFVRPQVSRPASQLTPTLGCYRDNTAEMMVLEICTSPNCTPWFLLERPNESNTFLLESCPLVNNIIGKQSKQTEHTKWTSPPRWTSLALLRSGQRRVERRNSSRLSPQSHGRCGWWAPNGAAVPKHLHPASWKPWLRGHPPWQGCGSECIAGSRRSRFLQGSPALPDPPRRKSQLPGALKEHGCRYKEHLRKQNDRVAPNVAQRGWWLQPIWEGKKLI